MRTLATLATAVLLLAGCSGPEEAAGPAAGETGDPTTVTTTTADTDTAAPGAGAVAPTAETLAAFRASWSPEVTTTPVSGWFDAVPDDAPTPDPADQPVVDLLGGDVERFMEFGVQTTEPLHEIPEARVSDVLISDDVARLEVVWRWNGAPIVDPEAERWADYGQSIPWAASALDFRRGDDDAWRVVRFFALTTARGSTPTVHRPR